MQRANFTVKKTNRCSELRIEPRTFHSPRPILSIANQWIYHQTITYGWQLIYITLLSWFYPVERLNREIITSLLEKNNACTLVPSPCEYHWTKVKLCLENLQKNVGQKPQLWQTIFLFFICWFDIRICDKSHP